MEKARTITVLCYLAFLILATMFFVPWKITYSAGLNQPQEVGVLYKPLWYQVTKYDLRALREMDENTFNFSTFYGATIDFSRVGTEFLYATFLFIVLYIAFSAARAG
jgi:hypothetical protein